MTTSIESKRDRLLESLATLDSVVVAYSGGVDSTLLAAAAHRVLGDAALAVTADSPSLARRELRDAVELARTRGWRHEVVETFEVERPEYVRNDPQRCYWCKTELFEVLQPIADRLGASLAVGTNVDDLSDHRPGRRAAREHRVTAPLVEAGLSKAEVRDLSLAWGLPTSEKPASPCLASRFAYGVAVTVEGLARVEAAEEMLRGLGFVELRVRDHGDLARIEVPRADIDRLTSVRDEVAERLRELGYVYVTVDLEGFRSGAMNEVLTPRFRSEP